MPNIGNLPSAADLLDSQATSGEYGSHLRWQRVDDAKPGVNAIALLTNDRSVVLAQSGETSATVDLRLVDSTTVPYVNAFIAHTGQKVDKYWRTKQYRLVGGSPVATKVAPAVARTVPAPVALPLANPEAQVISDVFNANLVEVEATPAVEAVVIPVAVPESDPGIIPGVEHPAKVKVKSAGKGFTRVGEIVVSDEGYQTLLDAWTLRQNGVPSSVLITGPAGTAKTALVRSFAASLGVPFLKVDGGAIRTADDWAGAFRQDPNTKVWAHRWSPFARCLQVGDPMVILIDEINRTESPQALNNLLGLLDWTGQLLVPDANTTLMLPPGVLVVATANVGPEFVGTLPIDGAVRQRFPYGVRMGYPSEAIEASLLTDLAGVDREVSNRLVKMANLQRINREDPQQYPSGSVISTRVILDIARRIATCNTAPRDAVWATLRGQFDPGDEQALSIVVDTQFPPVVVEDDESEEVDADADGAALGEQPCPSCGTANPVGLASCSRCGYGLPQAPGLIRLQNTQYPQSQP